MFVSGISLGQSLYVCTQYYQHSLVLAKRRFVASCSQIQYWALICFRSFLSLQQSKLLAWLKKQIGATDKPCEHNWPLTNYELGQTAHISSSLGTDSQACCLPRITNYRGDMACPNPIQHCLWNRVNLYEVSGHRGINRVWRLHYVFVVYGGFLKCEVASMLFETFFSQSIHCEEPIAPTLSQMWRTMRLWLRIISIAVISVVTSLCVDIKSICGYENTIIIVTISLRHRPNSRVYKQIIDGIHVYIFRYIQYAHSFHSRVGNLTRESCLRVLPRKLYAELSICAFKSLEQHYLHSYLFETQQKSPAVRSGSPVGDCVNFCHSPYVRYNTHSNNDTGVAQQTEPPQENDMNEKSRYEIEIPPGWRKNRGYFVLWCTDATIGTIVTIGGVVDINAFFILGRC